MSINITVDSDVYSGIRTINIGDKTLSLSEVDATGGTGYASGTITPSEAVGNCTINTGLDTVHGFFIAGKTSFSANTGAQTTDALLYDGSDQILWVGSASDGNGQFRQGGWFDVGNIVTFDDSGNIVINMGSTGYSFATITYNWSAW